jgi:hypothetical protein
MVVQNNFSHRIIQIKQRGGSENIVGQIHDLDFIRNLEKRPQIAKEDS